MTPEQDKAAKDALNYGIGILKTLPDGTQKRIAPEDLAAADMGPQTDLELVNRGLMGKIQLLQKERKQTIERCAQVADDFGDDKYNDKELEIADAIAAAIRALKDKP